MDFLKRFNQLREKDFSKDDSELLEFYDKLPTVDVDEIISPWKGGDFNTGHFETEALQNINWFGKWYKSPSNAIPLVCYTKDNKKLYSDQAMKGEASLWNIEFRGKVSATMVYDGVPVFDHFRKVDDNTLMGIMNGKQVEGQNITQNGRYYFFYLERLTELPLEFTTETTE